MHNNIKYNESYSFDLTNKLQWGNLSPQTLNEIFKDGRVTSSLCERHTELWFPDLKYVNEKGYDFVDNNNQKYEMKSFTKGSGCKFCPSSMVGSGRKIDFQILSSIVECTNYILCDITEFPKIRICFWKGKDLLEKYPSANIGYSYENRRNLFG